MKKFGNFHNYIRVHEKQFYVPYAMYYNMRYVFYIRQIASLNI